jgi:lipopolysaccharide export system permease protein
MVVAYHKVNQWAEDAGARGDFQVELVMYTPFILFAGLIVWMYRTLATKPGGQPIGALERGGAKAMRFIKRLLPKPRRSRAAA